MGDSQDYDVRYTIHIEYRGATQDLGFVSDAWDVQKLGVGESILAELFTRLEKSMFSRMQLGDIW